MSKNTKILMEDPHKTYEKLKEDCGYKGNPDICYYPFPSYSLVVELLTKHGICEENTCPLLSKYKDKGEAKTAEFRGCPYKQTI